MSLSTIRPETLVAAVDDMRTWHLEYQGADRDQVLAGVRGNVERIRDGLCQHVNAADEPEQRVKARSAFYRAEEVLHELDVLLARRSPVLGPVRIRPRRREGRPTIRRRVARRRAGDSRDASGDDGPHRPPPCAGDDERGGRP